MKKIIALVMFCLFIIPGVALGANSKAIDFKGAISAPDLDIVAAPNEDIEKTFTLNNLNDFDITYHLEAFRGMPVSKNGQVMYVKASEQYPNGLNVFLDINDFTLKKGEKKEVILKTKAPNLKIGTFIGIIDVSISGEQKDVKTAIISKVVGKVQLDVMVTIGKDQKIFTNYKDISIGNLQVIQGGKETQYVNGLPVDFVVEIINKGSILTPFQGVVNILDGDKIVGSARLIPKTNKGDWPENKVLETQPSVSTLFKASVIKSKNILKEGNYKAQAIIDVDGKKQIKEVDFYFSPTVNEQKPAQKFVIYIGILIIIVLFLISLVVFLFYNRKKKTITY